MTAHRTATRRKLALALIAAKPNVTVRELARSIGLAGPSSALFVIRGLERDGLIRRESCAHCGHPTYVVQ